MDWTYLTMTTEPSRRVSAGPLRLGVERAARHSRVGDRASCTWTKKAKGRARSWPKRPRRRNLRVGLANTLLVILSSAERTKTRNRSCGVSFCAARDTPSQGITRTRNHDSIIDHPIYKKLTNRFKDILSRLPCWEVTWVTISDPTLFAQTGHIWKNKNPKLK